MDIREMGVVRTPEDLLVEVPRWWGITVGSLAYAVFASDHDSAIDIVFDELGISRKGSPVPVIFHEHDDEAQPLLTERFGTDEQAVRVVPFSIEPWPDPNS
ncbi:MAG: hypothetical protein HYV38_02730 [Candidatus Levybacteria bacterium]|nr:hypothetical protein [Candidatus Levybacteria bacterium]